MSATYNYIESTGVISIDTSELLTEVQSEWIESLGNGLDVDASTPQGTLIQGETLARTSVMKNNAEVANLLNPEYAYGVYLDTIAAFLGINRAQSTKTQGFQLAVTGRTTATTTVPAGSRVRTSNGDIFVVATNFTIPTTGSTVCDVVAQEFGPIPLPLDSELTIVDGVIGWGDIKTVANTTIVTGSLALNDSQLKSARKRRLFQQGLGSLGAIYANLAALDGVTSVNAIENATGAAGTVNGITFSTPNGVWVCVDGTADDREIAKALWKSHMGGQPWDYGGVGQGTRVGSPNGISVNDEWSNQSYFVKFNRPVVYDLYVNVIAKQGTSIASISDVQGAIIDYSNGLINGEEGFVVGASVSSYELASAINFRYPGLYVKDVKVAGVPTGSPTPVYPTAYSTEFTATPFQKARALRAFIAVTFV